MKKSAVLVVSFCLLFLSMTVSRLFAEGAGVGGYVPSPEAGAVLTGQTSGTLGAKPGSLNGSINQIPPVGTVSSTFSANSVKLTQTLPSSQNNTIANTSLDNAQGPSGRSGMLTPEQIQQQCQQQCLQLMLPYLQQQCQQQCQQRSQRQIVPQQQGQQQPQLLVSPQPGGENGRMPRVTLPELSAVERSMSGEDRTVNEMPKSIPFGVSSIYQYGYSFFQGGTVFSPLTDVPVGPEYIIGAGDWVVLTAWGSLEGTYELEVNRNGEITLPKVGTVKIQGVTYGQLSQVLRSHLSRVFKDFQLSATLGRTRLIKVYLVGEVVAPGDYTVSSLATVINALGAAGGPTKNGSLRNIQIKRGGKVAEAVDLYDFFLFGDKSRDVRVQPGDTIFVPPVGPLAGIAGNVRRPAIYELKGETTLKELLSLASGVNPSGYLQRVLITRTVPHDKTEALDFSLDTKLTGKSLDELTGSIAIKELDYVKIFPTNADLRGYVRLDGYILRPGDYALHPGMKVTDLLKPENLLAEYADGNAELVRLFPPDFHPEYLSFSPAKALTGDPTHNLELKEFDRIRIFSRWELEELPLVRVHGEVQKPGDYRLMRNMTVRDLLLQAGNPKLTAYLVSAELIRTRHDGVSVTSSSVIVNLGEALKGNPKENILLEPLDELIVKRIPNWLEETERYAVIKGEVLFPGTYPLFKGEHLSDLIRRAGGFTDKSYLFGAKFTRQSVRKLQQERMDEMITRMEKNIAIKEQELAAAATTTEEVAATKLALDGLKNSMEKIKYAKAEGRIAIKLEPLNKQQHSPYDLELMGGDTLEIPQSIMAVTVLGEVANTTSTIWLPGKDVSYYLDMAGGPTGGAETDEMYVIMADGNVRGKISDGAFSFLSSGGFLSTKLHAGDTVIVPQKLERVSWMKELKDITQILGNLAVTAGIPLAIIKP